MLVLFDIDGTLLKSRGVGLRAMQAALEEIHPARHPEDTHEPSNHCHGVQCSLVCVSPPTSFKATLQGSTN